MYIPRYLENVISSVNKNFKVLYLGGPRQVGKTTLLKHLANKRKMNYVTLDDLNLRKLANNDPELFLETYKTPLLIDEVQYAPELFPYIKIKVDSESKTGKYWLTGSQQFSVLKNIQESLAGRVGVLSLLGLSMAEEKLIPKKKNPFGITNFNKTTTSPTDYELSIENLFKIIHRGSFPALVTKPSQDFEIFYNSYLQTYLDRDLRDIFGIQKLSQFHLFLELCAARTGQILNFSELARDAGISVHAAKEWIQILEGTSQIYLLRPYYKNISKRLIKAPKIYFLDTGLAAFLTKWKTPETLLNGAMAGHFFETFIISEVLKSYLFRGKQPPIYYYRDKAGREVDLLIESNGKLIPFEIKKTIKIKDDDIKHIKYLQTSAIKAEKGAIICLNKKFQPYNRNVTIIPVQAIQ